MNFKIIRDGKEIELTYTELMDAHSAYEKKSIIEDIKSSFEDEGFPVISEDNIPAIADNALHNLSKCDPYFEAFWETVRQTISCEIKKLASAEYDRLKGFEFKSDNKVSFLYKNVDGEECSFEGLLRTLYKDWMNECESCPSNDTMIYAIKLNDVSFEVLNFEEFMNVVSLSIIAKVFNDKTDVVDEDPSIGVNLLFNGEPATVTLQLYTQRDFCGTERSGIALEVQEKDGDYILTVSFGEFIGMKNAAYIDTNNNGTEFIDFLEANGYAKKTGFFKQSGFCMYPLYIFKEEFLKTAGEAEYAAYEKSYNESMSF